MPGYKATVVGENIEFVIDDESQCLDFYRTVFVNADNESSAQESALALVREDLLSQSLIEEWDETPISIEEIKQVDVLAATAMDSDFVWTFPEEEIID